LKQEFKVNKEKTEDVKSDGNWNIGWNW
jgi:hypothetical protein